MIDFNICENDGGKLWVDDLTDVVGGYNPGVRYDPESNTTMGYRRDASVAVYVLTRVRTKGEETMCVHVSMEPEASVSMDLPGDGYYKVTKILVPADDFVSADDYEEWRASYGATTYYYDRESGEFRKIVDTGGEVPEGDDVIGRFEGPGAGEFEYVFRADVMEIVEQCDGVITTMRMTHEWFSLFRFRMCVFGRNGEYIRDCPPRCVRGDLADSVATLLWLNASLGNMQLLIDCGRYMEAEKILEHLSVCGGPCADVSFRRKEGCGCGSRRS